MSCVASGGGAGQGTLNMFDTPVFFERRLEREPGFELTKPSTSQELHRINHTKERKKGRYKVLLQQLTGSSKTSTPAEGK